MFSILVLALASQETHPKNSEICDVYDNARDQYDCRKTLAGGLECHNNERRWNHTEASDKDIAWSVGMQCGSWPWYNGGYPLSKISLDSEHESYTCLRRNTTFCTEWEVFEQGNDEYEVGIFRCLEWDETHCLRWRGEQTEVKNCENGYSPNNHFRHTYCICIDDEYCDKGKLPHMENEVSEAECTSVKHGICATWTQREWSPTDGRAFTEIEHYTCESFGEYECDMWSGIISSPEELEVVECQRSPVDANSVYCTEEGHDMFFPNLGWAAFTIVIYVVAFLFCLFLYTKQKNVALCISSIVGASVVNILFIWLGGIAELVIGLGVAVLVVVAISVWVICKRRSGPGLTTAKVPYTCPKVGGIESNV